MRCKLLRVGSKATFETKTEFVDENHVSHHLRGNQLETHYAEPFHKTLIG